MPRGKRRGIRKPQGRFIASAEEMEARDLQDLKDGKERPDLEGLKLSDDEDDWEEVDDSSSAAAVPAFEKDKSLNVTSLIETANPNAKNSMGGSFIKASDLESAAPQELSRREREAIAEMEASRKRFIDNKAGTSEEAKSDMARLKLIREERAAAKARKEEQLVLSSGARNKKRDAKKKTAAAEAVKRSEELDAKIRGKGPKGKKGKNGKKKGRKGAREIQRRNLYQPPAKKKKKHRRRMLGSWCMTGGAESGF